VQRLALLLVVVVALAAGCGGGDSPKPAGRTDLPRAGEAERAGGGEEAAFERAARGLRPADRSAYFQAATAAGSVRARASLVVTGHPVARRFDLALGTALRHLDAARPRNRTLARLVPRVVALLRATRAAPSRGRRARRAARRQLAAVDRVSAALAGLLRSDPRYSALTPD
jgi:hypothetical protein